MPTQTGKIGLKAKEILTVDMLYICFDRWFSHFTGLTKDHFRSSSYEAKPLLNEIIKKQLRIKHQTLSFHKTIQNVDSNDKQR